VSISNSIEPNLKPEAKRNSKNGLGPRILAFARNRKAIPAAFLCLSVLLAVALIRLIETEEMPPPCMKTADEVLPINNEEVLRWKRETKHNFYARGHIKGVISAVYAIQPNDRPGVSHSMFQLTLGPGEDDIILMQYNRHFGVLPDLRVGMKVEACGEYVTKNRTKAIPAREARPASEGVPARKARAAREARPQGALFHIMHWWGAPETSGYIKIDGRVYGLCDESKEMPPGCKEHLKSPDD